MKLRALALAASCLGPLLGGCLAFQSPVVLDVTCPTGAELRAHPFAGACELPGGLKHGPAYVLARDTQRLLVYATYDHDALDGRYVRYRSDGTKAEEGTYFGGTKNGIWTTYDADGARTEQAYVDDYAKGPHKRFDADGTLRAEGAFEGADPDGTWTEYDAHGKTTRVTRYAKGVVQEQRSLDASAPKATAPAPPPKIEAPPTLPRADASTASNVDDMAAEAAVQAETTARVVSPAKTRIFPFDGDIAFEASLLLGQDSSTVRNSSGLVGGTLHLGAAFGSLRYKTDHYSGTYVAAGVAGTYGVVSRAECEVGSSFCGTGFVVGPYARVGYARSHHPREEGAIASFKAYMGLAALFGQQQWRVVGVADDAFVWRARVSAGYTGLSIFKHFLNDKHSGKGEDLLLLMAPLLLFVEHGELFFDMGMDRAGGVVGGFGINLGFGL